MPAEYPYMISNNKIAPIIAAIAAAAKPPKFSHEFLKQIGFSSSNDRAIIPLFKRLGFITENGNPTSYYDDLKDSTRWKSSLADRVRDLYSDIFAINTNMNSAAEPEIKGAFSRVTGKDAAAVDRYYSTFKTLVSLSDFNTKKVVEPQVISAPDLKPETNKSEAINKSHSLGEFHYNIQIHLPATTDISVYDAIFKSLRDNLVG